MRAAKLGCFLRLAYVWSIGMAPADEATNPALSRGLPGAETTKYGFYSVRQVSVHGKCNCLCRTMPPLRGRVPDTTLRSATNQNRCTEGRFLEAETPLPRNKGPTHDLRRLLEVYEPHPYRSMIRMCNVVGDNREASAY